MTLETNGERLNKFLALHQGISRRAADELIESGRVAVDGTPATLGARIPEGSSVTVDGQPIVPNTTYSYIAFNKPRGYVCSRKKQGAVDTIYSLLPKKYRTLNPVGRLDKDSSGLLLLTNDGDFAHQMTHPKFYKTKIYQVQLDSPLQPLHRQMISDFGVMLEDGKSQFQLERLENASDIAWRITMSEGRNRQIRRTFAALGYVVTQLHRTHFGPFVLNDLASGAYEEIQPLD